MISSLSQNSDSALNHKAQTVMQLPTLLSIPIKIPRISPKLATPYSFPIPSSAATTTLPRRKPFVCFSSAPDGKNGEENPAAVDDAIEKERRDPSLFNFRLGEILHPDPDNILAVVLTGVLAWASLQLLSQLFFVSLAILVAALKYSFIAAILLFILITLL